MEGYGNYLYCQECILSYINVGSQRLHRQRVLKQKLCIEPIGVMSKSEVCKQKLEQHVILPLEVTNLKEWWSCLDQDDDVDVKFPR